MIKTTASFLTAFLFIIAGMILPEFSLSGQSASKDSPALPDNIKKIVSVSCMPCHSDKGGLMSKGKLNFSEWTKYSPSKQIERAEKMFSLISKNKMPPKFARENNPGIIPTKEQTDDIKKWAESLKAGKK